MGDSDTNLFASEIHFSRNATTGENLHLSDKELSNEKISVKQDNNRKSAISKAPHGKPSNPTNANKGDIVYVKQHLTKNSARSPFVVTGNIGDKKLYNQWGAYYPIQHIKLLPR